MKKSILKFKRNIEIPIEAVKDFYLEIYSGNEVILTGFGEIEKLEDAVLKISFRTKTVIFYGNNINISNYSSDGIKISGDINKIEFLKKE
ncbi:MAG: hypothetical protein IJA05_01105 [Oscillospiraceae bacterium]|nr:hypothetical protein [Oscillospiraceae bacterium]